MKTASIRIERNTAVSLVRARKDFAGAWRSGKEHGAQFSFESPAALFRALTPVRWTLLERLQALGPSTLRGLARALERDVKAVHRDVHALLELGLMERDAKGLLRLPFERIHAEFDLAETA